MFFVRIIPFFDLDFLSSIKHPTAKRWQMHGVLLFLFFIVKNLFT